MTVVLKNNQLNVKINEKGAEIVSVTNKELLEYIWDADPRHWKRHAPILFPIVGRLQNDEYNYEGTIYKMYQHGFARDSEFEVVEHTNTKVVFLLQPNDEIKLHYPFKFKLYVTYILNGNDLSVDMLVKNEDRHSMYFSIGAHPGFRIPLSPEKESFNDYSVTIIPDHQYSLISLDKDGLTTTNVHNKSGLTDPLPISHHLFSEDAKIFDVSENKKTTFKISSKKGKHGVAVTAYNNQYFGLWSTYPQESDFVCVEPWWGIADSESSTGFIKDKKDISRLRCGEDFYAKFTIKFF
ncbi:galactose mutarotase [Fructilactobacillus lindneri]|uniref:Aldose 1-epimerase n=2 Tax=Fructilactobacillus lindneri TaxID=53444 RepID=A0A0R2JPB5_9LACO|nr:aldose 1-epimerase family protein [Fructilactobacillus lindneri]ANZ58170.1 galactose mutarotase [Fructilactobacillus lindneri]ANZ59491.1 galactose mutarotase [Fructilactobacillus lindneri]KRN78991.1 hypothetical protein IV52_GL000395 [Fructilactobacillus lindneri DSM 20690 = JCM 11027]POG98725.1 galactose mutarotase [Fructilactobacillus lindneri]POH02998.1 galactose mutarotase [Fructilactobacillus lindneri]